MKKTICLILLAAMMLVVFTGCSGSKNVDLKTVLGSVNSGVSDATTGLKELSDVSELQAYYQISPDDVKQFAAEIKADSSNAPVEIVLVEAKNADAANNVRTALDRRYNSIVSQYASYSPEQLAMANACEVTQNGNFVTMVVAENYADIMGIINAALK